MAKESPKWAVNLSDVQATTREWLWQDRIPAGELTLIAGIQGIGKSILITDILARITTGRMWPDKAICQEGSTILLPAEDNLSSTVRPRFEAAKADVDKVIIVRGAPSKQKRDRLLPFDLGRDFPLLVHLAETINNIKVLAIDPVGSYLGGIDVHRENMVRNVMFTLRAELAEKYGVAVVGIVHLGKGSEDKPALARVLGSVAFTGAARAVWGVAQDSEDPSRRLLVPMKHNLTSHAVTGLEFYIVSGTNGEGVIKWGEAIEEYAEEVMVDQGTKPQMQREKAKKMMIELLSKGSRSAIDVFEEIGSEGISTRTIKSAKKSLGVKSVKSSGSGGKWIWMLPTQYHL